MKREKRRSRVIPVFLLTVLFLVFFAAASQEPASAGTGYVTIHSHSGFEYGDGVNTWTKKVGKKYLKLVYNADKSSDGFKLYYSKKKNSGFRLCLKDASNRDLATNGSKMIYVKNFDNVSSGSKKLVMRTIGKKDEKILYTFADDYRWYTITGASGNHIYIEDFSNLSGYTYEYQLMDYNVSTGTMRYITKDTRTEILVQRGKLVIAGTIDSPHARSIYKIVSGKLKKVKKLDANYEASAAIIGSKIYYLSHKGNYLKGILYSCSLKGKNKKTLGKFIVPWNQDLNWLEIQKLTPKYCILLGPKSRYIYTFKGKKLKKISKKAMLKHFKHLEG